MVQKVKISLIAAVGNDNAIGLNGHLPWHLRFDSIYYRETINGFPVIMGRRTFEEIRKPYPNQVNVVVSATMAAINGIIICSTVGNAIETITQLGYKALFVIGGENIYREALRFATDLYITHVDTITPGGDSFFPMVAWEQWTVLAGETQQHEADSENDYDFKICHYQRQD